MKNDGRIQDSNTVTVATAVVDAMVSLSPSNAHNLELIKKIHRTRRAIVLLVPVDLRVYRQNFNTYVSHPTTKLGLTG